jgi:hypothetical protein
LLLAPNGTPHGAAADAPGFSPLAEKDQTWNTPLLARSTGMHAPPVGAMVRITVAGQAHVF